MQRTSKSTRNIFVSEKSIGIPVSKVCGRHFHSHRRGYTKRRGTIGNRLAHRNEIEPSILEARLGAMHPTSGASSSLYLDDIPVFRLHLPVRGEVSARSWRGAVNFEDWKKHAFVASWFRFSKRSSVGSRRGRALRNHNSRFPRWRWSHQRGSPARPGCVEPLPKPEPRATFQGPPGTKGPALVRHVRSLFASLPTPLPRLALSHSLRPRLACPL